MSSYRKYKSSVLELLRDLIYVVQNTFRFDGLIYGYDISGTGRL